MIRSKLIAEVEKNSQKRYRFLRRMSCEAVPIVKEKMYKDAN
ncbi:hypothetical protein BAT_3478 [Bacillus pumilus ATCC 7061]|nr:hypothetical protein BAT_3478 [Bacillus pumilus ATCC 7061]